MADIFDLFKKIEKKNTEPVGAPEYIVAGLGNPGAKYTHTRHNAGFMALDYIFEKMSITSSDRSKFKGLCRDGAVGGRRVMFIRPQTFMNLSGESVREAADFYDIPPERVIVLSDDVNLAVGRVRVRGSGSSGGQKGLENIILHMDSDKMPRIRIGVGSKPAGWDMADWVLGKIPEPDREDFFFALGTACEALELLISEGVEKAMGRCNGKTPPPHGED